MGELKVAQGTPVEHVRCEVGRMLGVPLSEMVLVDLEAAMLFVEGMVVKSDMRLGAMPRLRGG